MKVYFRWPYKMLERRNGKDRRINPVVFAEPEERKGERRKERRRAGIVEGFIGSLITKSKASCKGHQTSLFN